MRKSKSPTLSYTVNLVWKMIFCKYYYKVWAQTHLGFQWIELNDEDDDGDDGGNDGKTVY